MDKEDEFTHYYEIRQSFVLLAVKILFAELIIGLFHYAITEIIFLLGFHEFYVNNISIHVLELMITHSLNIVLILYFIVVWLNIYYTISPNKISASKGVITKQTAIYDLSAIQAVNVYQNLLGRIFNYGTIRLENPMLDSDIYIKKIPSPHKYALNIEHNRMDALKNRDQILVRKGRK